MKLRVTARYIAFLVLASAGASAKVAGQDQGDRKLSPRGTWIALHEKKKGPRPDARVQDRSPPREQIVIALYVKDVEKSMSELVDSVRASKGTLAASVFKREPDGRMTASLVFDIPLTAKDDLVKKCKGLGTVRAYRSTVYQDAVS